MGGRAHERRRREAGRAAAPAAAGARTTTLLVAAGLAVLTLAVFAQCVGFDFVTLDDLGYVADNPRVLAGLTASGAAWAFRTTAQANWHPLTWLSLMLDAQLGGPGARVFHLTNVILHLAGALLLFELLRRVTGALWRSAFVAALFAVHPLHVESVAWISERKDVLSGLFWMLTTLAYVRYARRPSVGRYAPVVLLFAVGLTAKPMLVSLPLALLLLDYWPLGRFGSPGADGAARAGDTRLAVLDKIPLAVLAAASSVVTLAAQQRGGAIGDAGVFPLAVRLANAVHACACYILDMFWPAGLAPLYPHPRNALPLWQVAAAAALLALATAAAVRWARKAPYFAVGWFWWLVTLVPVIGVVQVGVQARADRYTYIPMIGLFVIVAFGAPDLVRWVLARRGVPATGTANAGRVLAGAGTAVVVVLAACAFVQAGRWRDSVTLFEHTLAVTRDNGGAHDALGIALARRGEMERAIDEFRESLRIDPAQAEVHASLGSALARAGRGEAAAAEFGAALRLRPGDAGAHANLGTLLFKQGRVDEAQAELAEAVRLDPDNASAQKNLGVLLARRGDRDGAERCFSAAVRIDPADQGARANLERIRSMGGGQ